MLAAMRSVCSRASVLSSQPTARHMQTAGQHFYKQMHGSANSAQAWPLLRAARHSPLPVLCMGRMDREDRSEGGRTYAGPGWRRWMQGGPLRMGEEWSANIGVWCCIAVLEGDRCASRSWTCSTHIHTTYMMDHTICTGAWWPFVLVSRVRVSLSTNLPSPQV